MSNSQLMSSPALQLFLSDDPFSEEQPVKPSSSIRDAISLLILYLQCTCWVVMSLAWSAACWLKSFLPHDQAKPLPPRVLQEPIFNDSQPSPKPHPRRRPVPNSIPLPQPYESPKSLPTSPKSPLRPDLDPLPVSVPSKSRFSFFKFKSFKGKKRGLAPSITSSETSSISISTPDTPNFPLSADSVPKLPSTIKPKLGFSLGKRRATEPLPSTPTDPTLKTNKKLFGGLFGTPTPRRRTDPYAAPYFCPTPDEVARQRRQKRGSSSGGRRRSPDTASMKTSGSGSSTEHKSHPPVSGQGRNPFRRAHSGGILMQRAATMDFPSQRSPQSIRFDLPEEAPNYPDSRGRKLRRSSTASGPA